MAAGKPGRQPVMLSTEQLQQFTYYRYAAKQAIMEERYDEALVLLTFCHTLNPQDGYTLTYLGMIYAGTGDKARAQEAYRLAFEADPYDQWYKYTESLIDEDTEEGVTEAIRVMEKAYEVQKGGKKERKADEDLLRRLQAMYLYSRQWKQALTMQDEIDRIKGYDAYSALTRYRIYAQWGKTKQAIAAVDKYLELDPNDVQFLLFRLEIMERTGAKPKELYALYEKILAIAPYNLMVLNNYAYHLATHKGDLQKAERMSAVTIKEEPSNPVYLDTYGWILHMQGQDELALFYLNRALWNAHDEHNQNEINNHIQAIKNK